MIRDGEGRVQGVVTLSVQRMDLPLPLIERSYRNYIRKITAGMGPRGMAS